MTGWENLDVVAGAEADQIDAMIRDLTPGQRLGLIRACLTKIAHQGLMLAADDDPPRELVGPFIAGLAGLAGGAVNGLIHDIGAVQNADFIFDALGTAIDRVRGETGRDV